jgi:hypothetical protein
MPRSAFRLGLVALACLCIASPTATLAQTAPSPSPTATAAATSTPVAVTDTPVAPTDTPTAAATPSPAATAAAPDASGTPVAAPTPFVSGVPCATDDPSNEGVRRWEQHGNDDNDNHGNEDPFVSGNARNEVVVHNCTDNRLRVRASIDLNTIPGHKVQPLNSAYAEGSCNGCQTFAVALQIDVYSAERVTDFEPQNFAVALNTGCTGCITVARAVQYVQPSDDPRDVSRDIADTIEDLNSELLAIQMDPTVTLPDAEARLNSVLQRFNALGGSLGDQRQERDD